MSNSSEDKVSPIRFCLVDLHAFNSSDDNVEEFFFELLLGFHIILKSIICSCRQSCGNV